MPDARRLDDTAGRIEGRFYTQIGRIQQDRVVGLDHGGGIPARIPGVATADVLQHVGEGDVLASRRQLLPAPLGADLRRGGDIELGCGVGRDDRADVAPVQNGAAGLAGEVLLQLQQGGAHARMAGDPAGRLARVPLGQTRIVRQAAEIQRKGRRFGRLGVAQVLPRIQHRQTDGAIQQARIQMRQAVMGRQTRGDGALARGGGAVDGDDERLGQEFVFLVTSRRAISRQKTAKPPPTRTETP
ncbi:hypothetical protein D3C71_1474860 [compost metagenome]